MIIIVGLLGHMTGGTTVPLVSCVDTSSFLCCVLLCWIIGCLGMYHVLGRVIIRSLDPGSLQNIFLILITMTLCLSNMTMHSFS